MKFANINCVILLVRRDLLLFTGVAISRWDNTDTMHLGKMTHQHRLFTYLKYELQHDHVCSMGYRLPSILEYGENRLWNIQGVQK